MCYAVIVMLRKILSIFINSEEMNTTIHPPITIATVVPNIFHKWFYATNLLHKSQLKREWESSNREIRRSKNCYFLLLGAGKKESNPHKKVNR